MRDWYLKRVLGRGTRGGGGGGGRAGRKGNKWKEVGWGGKGSVGLRAGR